MAKFPTVLHSRNTYIERIKPFMRTPIVKVMVGHRRVGKSYILFQLIELIISEEKEANIIYINKEDIDFVDIVSYKELHDYISQRLVSDKRNYIFIDEIQEIEDFKVSIRSLALDDNNDIYITGSNSEMFSSDLANELGGRYVEFRIYSLSYLEFLSFHKLPNDDTSLEKYNRFGGLPYLIHLPLDEAVVMEYIRSVYSTIVLRDVVERKKIRNTAFLEQLIRFLANNIGSLFSSKSISDFLKSQNIKISPNQVSEYADSLASAFIVHKIGRYDIAGKKFFERGEKYFFENMGIRNVIAGYKPQDRAKRMENIVCNHLLYCGYEVTVGSIATEEIDFVCTRGNETIYVQVAVELSRPETIAREFGNLLKIKDNYPKIVVSGERSFEDTYEGVEHIYIRDFLSSTLTPKML
ncbi:ATPase component BioM of energizing module of biotin ECF transporter [Mucinivorans hirudinis]|uniref:ATPase component BioM of energizing module of biotin ECF transporter n=1 Tax=Mucinivorans hirudinis TaxID=1433126 RepID=A0A060RBK4_9BACT|nr:ATPase component BioM of energizing module of biotin ECF transporter [Mucinivorans hirudinis]